MPLEIVIRYHAGRGYEDAALVLARRIFATFDSAIDSIALAPLPDADDSEDFDCHLNGELLVSQRQSGRAPLVADLRAALAATGFDVAAVQQARQAEVDLNAGLFP